MMRKTVCMLALAVAVCVGVWGQSRDFVMDGTTLISYRGIAANVTIPAGVTAIGDHAFSLYSGLASVTIPEGVTAIGDFAFAGCGGLTSVTIPASVTRIGDSAFAYCYNLPRVTIPPNIAYIGFAAFGGCNNLSAVMLHGVIINDRITIGADAFPAAARFVYLD